MLLPGSLASAQEADTPVFRAGSSLVRVDVQVIGRGGRVLGDLQAEDFAIYDEGQAREIAHFGRESEPLDLLLLLDVSGSMRRSIERMAETARLALRQLHPDDRVGVMLFARQIEVWEEFTKDFALVSDGMKDAVKERGLGTGTAINEGLLAAARHMGAQPVRGRRAILIVTDNMGLNYRVSDEQVLRALYAADSVLNAILIGKQKHPDPAPRGAVLNPDFTPPDVFKLAEESGGEALEAGKIGETFAQMIERIRARYSLHYAPPEDLGESSFRRIRVELTPQARRRHSSARIRARAGYYPGRMLR